MKIKDKIEEIDEEINQIDAIQFILASGIIALFAKVYEIHFLFYVALFILIYGLYLMIFHKKKKPK